MTEQEYFDQFHGIEWISEVVISENFCGQRYTHPPHHYTVYSEDDQDITSWYNCKGLT